MSTKLFDSSDERQNNVLDAQIHEFNIYQVSLHEREESTDFIILLIIILSSTLDQLNNVPIYCSSSQEPLEGFGFHKWV